MLTRKSLNYILVVLSLVFVVSCATTGSNTMLTPKQQLTIFMQTYNAQYDNVYAVMTNPASTEAQKTVARQKKAILVQMWPLLIASSKIIDVGGTPAEQDTAAIIALIDQLTVLATGGK